MIILYTYLAISIAIGIMFAAITCTIFTFDVLDNFINENDPAFLEKLKLHRAKVQGFSATRGTLFLVLVFIIVLIALAIIWPYFVMKAVW